MPNFKGFPGFPALKPLKTSHTSAPRVSNPSRKFSLLSNSSSDSDTTLSNELKEKSSRHCATFMGGPLKHCASPKPLTHPPKKVSSARSKWRNTDILSLLELALVVGESSDIPYLKGLAGIAFTVVDNVQATKDNETQCLGLLKMVREVITIVDEISKTEQSPHITMALESLTRRCDNIHDALNAHSKRKFVIRLSSAKRDSRLLKACNTELKTALELLQVKTNIGTIAAVNRKNTLDEKLVADIRQFVCLARETAITAEPIHEVFLPEELPVIVTETETLVLPDNLHRLPSPPQIFYGRDEELRRLEKVFAEVKPAHAVICGPGGVGKSSLGRYLLHLPSVKDSFQHRRYYVDCRSMEGLKELELKLEEVFEMTCSSRRELLQRLAKVDSNCLIFLDNLDTLWEPSHSQLQVEDLLTELYHCPSVSLVVTLRGIQRPLGPNWTKPYLPPLSPLSLSSARDVFLTISDASEDDPDIDTLIREVDCLPLPVTILAHLAQFEPPMFLVDRLGEEGVGMLRIGSAPEDGTSDVEESIRQSLCSPRMAKCPFAVTVLKQLADAVNSTETGSISRRDFLKAIKTKVPPVTKGLSALAQTSLILEDESGNLRVSRLLRDYLGRHSHCMT